MAGASLERCLLVRIQSSATPEHYLHNQYGRLEAGPIEECWWSAQWKVQRVNRDDEFVHLQNRWKPAERIHVQDGGPAVGEIEQHEHSAQWKLLADDDSEDVQLQNRWRPDCFLQCRSGATEAGPVPEAWPPTRWKLQDLHTGRTHSVAGPRALWLSLDPRNGEVNLYPYAVAVRLEAARLLGVGYVALSGFGGFFENAWVELRNGRLPVQRTPKGGRDALRVDVSGTSSPARVLVGRQRCGRWRLRGDGTPDAWEQRVLFSAADTVAAKEEGDAQTEVVPLWQWCRALPHEDPDTVARLPLTQWGLYSEEQNAAIEEALRAGRLSVPLTIGIRNYELVFEEGYSKQKDRALGKTRLARRILVPPAQREALQRVPIEGARTAGLGEGDECAICCEEFEATRTVPVLRVPGCGHRFHAACAQQLADRNDRCPICRGEVDWPRAFRARSRSRGE